jgi:hypothetical protein
MPSRAAIVFFTFLIGVAMWAADPPVRYVTCPVSKLEIIEGTLPLPKYGNQLFPGDRIEIWPDRQVFPPKFSIKWDGQATSELIIESGSGGMSWDHVFLAVRTANAGPPTGRFEFIDGDKKLIVRFRVPDHANVVRAAEWFQYGKAARIDRLYRELLRDPNTPGQAWLRTRIRDAAALRNEPLKDLWRNSSEPHHLSKQYPHEPMEPDPGWVSRITIDDWGSTNPWRWRNRADYAELLGGGRAVAENLQLDRQMRVVDDPKNNPRVKIDTVKGISIRAYDWGPHIRGVRPTFDSLAALIPADQHAVFFPDAAAAVSVLEEIDRTGLGVFNLTATRSVDDRITDRYMKQLAIPAAQLGKLLPTDLVGGVAVTGSDLYYDTGTDVAVLLATNRPAAVKQLLFAVWQSISAANLDAVDAEEKIGDIKCRVLRTPDRRVCAYVCEVPGAVLLTNSPAQIRRIAMPPANAPALESLPEYTFFRDRYRRGEADETAFAILSDDAIRRWCGPRWRIAHQRRIRTGALLADAQAKFLTDLVAANKLRTLDEPGLGPIDIGPRAVRSAVHGTRLFQTPIAEVEIDEVTAAEADAYNRWRDSYQQNWSQFFDPIAVRLTVKPDRLAADLSVLPLIAATQYREMMAMSTGAKLAPTAGDPHPEAIAHFVLGLNRKNEEFANRLDDFNRLVDDKVGIKDWIGDWVTLYADDDPIWTEFAKSKEREWEFWERHGWRIPVGVAVGVRDPIHLAAFLVALKATIEKHAPNLVTWTPMNDRGIGYMKASAKVGGGQDGIAVYSLPLPDRWLLTLNENVLKRAIDRHLARKANNQPVPLGPGWLGDSVAMSAKPEAAKYLREWWGRSMLSSMQMAAWTNLPILNEWHALNPASDPVAFHEQWWGERLLCPAGGTYVWNDADGTMESKALGHPSRPKGTAGMLPALLNSIRGGQFGITFERDGLRARVDIRRE